MHMHENMDDDFLVHQIVTYDYNNPAHDNVTCEMVVSPDENNMFELVHDGLFKHDCKCIRTMSRNTCPCKDRYQGVAQITTCPAKTCKFKNICYI